MYACIRNNTATNEFKWKNFGSFHSCEVIFELMRGKRQKKINKTNKQINWKSLTLICDFIRKPTQYSRAAENRKHNNKNENEMFMFSTNVFLVFTEKWRI